jgi:thymidylate synthase
MWFAHHAGLRVGSMLWDFGDAHIYREPTHQTVVDAILSEQLSGGFAPIELQYTPTSEAFLASDFTLVGEIPAPASSIRPTLL